MQNLMHEDELREIAASILYEAGGDPDAAVNLLHERLPDLDERMERFIREEAATRQRYLSSVQ